MPISVLRPRLLRASLEGAAALATAWRMSTKKTRTLWAIISRLQSNWALF